MIRITNPVKIQIAAIIVPGKFFRNAVEAFYMFRNVKKHVLHPDFPESAVAFQLIGFENRGNICKDEGGVRKEVPGIVQGSM